MVPESHGWAPAGSRASAELAAFEGSSVTVCITWLVLRHVTVAPRGTVTVAGSNLRASVICTVAAETPATAALGDGLTGALGEADTAGWGGGGAASPGGA